MKLFCRVLLGVFFFALSAFADESTVYSCRFSDDPNGFSSLRMKKYFSTTENAELGKVDLIKNFIVVESTLTKVYQIPIWEKDYYIQMWYSPNLRVDAQISNSPGSEFAATYTKGGEKSALVCAELPN